MENKAQEGIIITNNFLRKVEVKRNFFHFLFDVPIEAEIEPSTFALWYLHNHLCFNFSF